MENEFSRTQMLLGKEAIDKLQRSSIAVFGIGGVGSYAVEALARSAVGALALFDSDEVSISNINRQLIATHKTLGLKKVEAAKERILEINPYCRIEIYPCFYCADNAADFDLAKYDYIVDAIDTVTSKLILIEKAKEANVPVISSMGAGNKLDPTRFEVADIFETSVCPLAKVMRKELKARGISSLKVVYSQESIIKPSESENNNYQFIPDEKQILNKVKRQVPGSVAYVPSVAGLILASEVIKDLVSHLYQNS